MQWGRIVPVVVLAVVVAGGLAGCDAEGRIQSIGPRTSVSSCTDYVPMTAAERRESADLVVEGQVTKTDRTVEIGGVYDVYDAEVTTTSKGRPRAPPSRSSARRTSARRAASPSSTSTATCSQRKERSAST